MLSLFRRASLAFAFGLAVAVAPSVNGQAPVVPLGGEPQWIPPFPYSGATSALFFQSEPTNPYEMLVAGGIWGSPVNRVAFNATIGAAFGPTNLGIFDLGLADACLGDVDGDGVDELLMQTGHFQLGLFELDGQPVPGWPVDLAPSCTNFGFLRFALADIDGDGSDEIVATAPVTCSSSTFNYSVRCLNADATSVPGFPVSLAAEFWATDLAVADLEFDGSLDIIVPTVDTSGFSFGERRHYAFEADGSPKAGWPVFPIPGSSNQVSVAVGDLDGEGLCEVVFGSSYRVRVYRNTGTQAADYAIPAAPGGPPFFGRSIALGDMTGDGNPDIVTTGATITIYDFPVAGPIAQRTFTSPDYFQSADSVTIGDVDGDLVPEIAIAGRFGPLRVHMVDAQLDDLPGFPIQNSLGVSPPDLSEVQLIDHDFDGDLELAYGSQQGIYLYELAGEGDGTLEWEGATGTRKGSRWYEEGRVVEPFVRGDANGDGVVQLVDAVRILDRALNGFAGDSCPRAFDANDNDLIEFFDAIPVLQVLFVPNSPPLPSPFPSCGVDLNSSFPCSPTGTCP